MRNLCSVAAVLLTAAAAAAQCNNITIPVFSNTFSASFGTRGYFFQAPTTFVIDTLQVPDETGAGFQAVEVRIDSTPYVPYPATTTPSSVFYSASTPSNVPVQTGGVLVNAGDWVGILGACHDGASTLMHNSYAAAGPFATSILGSPVTLDRFLTQTSLVSGGGQPVSTEPGFNISRVEMCVSPAMGFATATPFGTGCGGTGPASFYELFDGGSNINDLGTGTGLGWTAIWGGSTYVVINTPISGFVPPTGTAVAFTDDNNQTFNLPNPTPTQGGMVSTFEVCSNGFVVLGVDGSVDYTESVIELLGAAAPRFCAYWDDLNPGSGGSMFVEETNNDGVMHVTWMNVPEFSATGMNTFQCSIDSLTGTVECNYGAMSSLDGLVGYSPGGGAADPGGVDITGLPTGTLTLGTGVPNMTLTPTGRPVIGGAAASIRLDNIPAGAIAGAWLLGFNGFDPGIPLATVGAPGCELHTNGTLTQIPFTPTPGMPSTFTQAIPVPVVGSFVGLRIFIDGAVIDPALNALGVGTGNGVLWTADMN